MTAFTLQFLIESTMVECDPFLKYLPSTIAAAATCLARYTMGQEAWVCIPHEQAHRSIYLGLFSVVCMFVFKLHIKRESRTCYHVC